MIQSDGGAVGQPEVSKNADGRDRGIAEMIEIVARSSQILGYASPIHPIQWSALRYLARAEAPARTVTALARFLGVTPGSASRTVDALIRKNLLIREADPRDRRVQVLGLTEAGTALMDSDPLTHLADAVGVLNADQKAALAAGLEQVLERVLSTTDDQSGRAVPRDGLLRYFQEMRN